MIIDDEKLVWRKPEEYDESKYDWVLAHVGSSLHKELVIPIPFIVTKIQGVWYDLNKSPVNVVDWRPIEPEREPTGYAAAMMQYKMKLLDIAKEQEKK